MIPSMQEALDSLPKDLQDKIQKTLPNSISDVHKLLAGAASGKVSWKSQMLHTPDEVTELLNKPSVIDSHIVAYNSTFAVFYKQIGD